MFNNFKTTVGIEMHVVVNSNTKMFSNARSSHNDLENTNVNFIDLGLPGVMPSVNKEVVRKAIVLAKALNMNIQDKLIFDRKNYFYQDLPKGFQITQQFFPIGYDGYIDIEIDGATKRIEIERIHIEEDTAKQIKDDNGNILLDYNRAGMPLIEIVSKPSINSAEEAEEYIKSIRRILQFNSISDAKMEDGSLRADVNISIAPFESERLGVRSEIKNINSIANVGKAIRFEERRKFEEIISSKEAIVDTRRFDDKTNTTIFMREKTTEIDYRYMTEPNIISMEISNKFKQESIDKYFVGLNEILNKLKTSIDDTKIVNHILSDFEYYKIFTSINNDINDPLEVYKWLFIEYNGILSKENKSLLDIDNDDILKIVELIKLIKNETINQKQAKVLIKEINVNKNKSVIEIVEKLGLKQINDENIMLDIFERHFDNSMIDEYKTRPERVEKLLIGKLMKDTNGQANPNIAKNVFNKFIGNKVNNL